MDQLEKVAKDLVASSKRQNTRRTYNSAQRHYIDFCKQYKLTILPSDQNTLLLYVAHMYRCNYKINSIKVYLSAVRAMNIEEGYSNPLEDAIKVDLALRAITINSKAPCQKLPITYQLLCRVSQYINKSYESKLLWAAMTIGHFGLLRASEFVIASQGKFSAEKDLSLGDVEFHDLEKSKYISLLIKRSKTDKRNQGFKVLIGCTEQKVCAYCAMKSFFTERMLFEKDKDQPLFLYKNGVVLSRHILRENTELYLSLIGVDSKQYSGHSYRIGGATTMAAAGMSDWEIKLSGRWSSSAYQRYIRTPSSLVIGFARRMTSVPSMSVFQMRNSYIQNIFGGNWAVGSD